MSLKEKIKDDLKASMKSGDTARRSVLRLLSTDIRNKEIDLRKELSDDDIVVIVKSNAKKRTDSIELYKKGNRSDLVEKEESELSILKEYMPKQMNEGEIKKIVMETIKGLGASDASKFGIVMKEVMKKGGSAMDGKIASEVIKKELGK